MKTSTEKYKDPAGHRQRLRDRFLRSGREGLPDYELLELLLTYSLPRVNTKPIAKALLHKFGTIVNVFQQPNERLGEIQGIGPNTITFFRVFQDCLTRCMEVQVENQRSISCPEDLFAFIRMHLGSRTVECIYALYLNQAQRIVHQTEVAAGTVNRTPFYPRELLKPALIYNATGMILVHNHPEGRPVPSDLDLEMTKKLEDLAALFDIKLLDHLIVTQQQAYSIKTGKLL
jgi:DNA repair protein RadC